MFALESPHQDDTNEYTKHTIFNIKKKITLKYPRSAVVRFFQGTEERVRNSRGKRAISVRAIDWLVGCFRLNGPFRQYFSLYRAYSKREGERKEK